MVLVYSDNKKLTNEMLSKASEIAKDQNKKVTAVIIGKKQIVELNFSLQRLLPLQGE